MDASFSARLAIEADAACFRRPEFSDDLVSYDALPPTVARRVLGRVYGTSSGTWVVQRIIVRNPILLEPQILRTPKGERRCVVLRNVAYVIEAQFYGAEAADLDSPSSTNEVIHLGVEGSAARFVRLTADAFPAVSPGTGETRDLGWMIFDLKGSVRQRPRYFRAHLQDGVMDLRHLANSANLMS